MAAAGNRLRDLPEWKEEFTENLEDTEAETWVLIFSGLTLRVNEQRYLVIIRQFQILLVYPRLGIGALNHEIHRHHVLVLLVGRVRVPNQRSSGQRRNYIVRSVGQQLVMPLVKNIVFPGIQLNPATSISGQFCIPSRVSRVKMQKPTARNQQKQIIKNSKASVSYKRGTDEAQYFYPLRERPKLQSLLSDQEAKGSLQETHQ